MGRVFAYCRRSTPAGVRPQPPVAAQRRLIAQFAAVHRLTIGTVFTDAGPTAWRTPWETRPTAGRLLAAASRGDAVLIASFGVICSTARESPSAFATLADRGIFLLVAAGPGGPAVLTPDESREVATVLAPLAEIDRRAHRKLTREWLALYRRAGLRCSGRPPLGVRWSLPDGGRFYRVPASGERAIMEQIRGFREAGLSWRQIGATLIREGIANPRTGRRDWSKTAVRRWCSREPEAVPPIPGDRDAADERDRTQNQ